LIHAEAFNHLRAGRPQAAAALLRAALETQPTDAPGWFLLGACLHALKDLPSATAAFARSLALDPANSEAHLAYVAVLRAAGNNNAALAAAKKAVGHIPNDARLLLAAALCFEDAGDADSAVAHYDAATQIEPTNEDAHFNKALLLARIGRHHQSSELLARLREGNPRSARIKFAYVEGLISLGRFDDALAALGQSTNSGTLDTVQRGVALAALRRFDESRTQFAVVLSKDAPTVHDYLRRIAPGARPEHMLSPENIYLGYAWTALTNCNWSNWEGFVTEMRRIAIQPGIVVEPAVAFMCQHSPLSGEQRRAISRRIAEEFERRESALPPPPVRIPGPIRIGLLSADFYEDSGFSKALPLLELIDRERFHITAYALGLDVESEGQARVASAAGSFVSLGKLDDDAAALKIRSDDIDILVDLTGHKSGGRFGLVAKRPARLQVSYRGFSSPIASLRVDYAIVDQTVGGDDAEWLEARAFLPHTYYLHDYRREAPNRALSRRDYGLPDDGVVYCAFHKAEKINPDVFAMWMQILNAVRGSVLWLRAPGAEGRARLGDEAVRHHIDPARIVFAPVEPRLAGRYLARQRLGDLMLDTLYHNAIESACDALGEGLPVLTVRGSATASRAGESLVCAAGLPELVANNLENYVDIAVRLGTDGSALSALKQRLVANRRTAPLFDTAGRVRALEAAFRGMYDRMMRGEPPASFDVRL
jgi:protein O-GlcNAc transferase